MKIYNTLTGKKEGLEDLIPGKEMKLFVCGPTVYDYAHIGNARTYIAFDTIVNYLRSQGLKVFYLQNITDIDDKIIRRAAEENTTAAITSRKYERAYHEDEKNLGINSVSKYASATKYVKQIVAQIQILIKGGHAYKIENDGYYFDISTFPEYGKLSKRTVAQAEDSVSRIDDSINKKNKGDFALWKFSKNGEPFWNTALGKGRPGWHIEDTAITEYYFGPQYDLHGGAIDLKFPHHEAEIAQQESASGLKPLAKIWMHTGFLLVNGEKMSKSLGNFITIRDFLKKHSPATLRYVVLSHHYRSPIDYNEKLAEAAEKTLDSVNQFLAKLKMVKAHNESEIKIDDYGRRFHEKMDDDFNTAEALAVIFNLISEVNPKIWQLGRKDSSSVAKLVISKLKLFRIELPRVKIPLKIRWFAHKRELSRRSKQFAQSDILRKQIEELGYTIEDTPAGPFLWQKNPH